MRTMTAVEWLVAQVNADCTNSLFIRKELVDEALDRERKQIQSAFEVGKTFNNPLNYNVNEKTNDNACLHRDDERSTSTV